MTDTEIDNVPLPQMPETEPPAAPTLTPEAERTDPRVRALLDALEWPDDCWDQSVDLVASIDAASDTQWGIRMEYAECDVHPAYDEYHVMRSREIAEAQAKNNQAIEAGREDWTRTTLVRFTVAEVAQ